MTDISVWFDGMYDECPADTEGRGRIWVVTVVVVGLIVTIVGC